ncbi:MAG: aminotransferase class I/II-fold pyridoxal phosphate-dependent enzyme [Eubacterium sp.]|nr:aminotransferase class I/II-fold pyridoxal phosphate-dependent enzyme [Eubacterium sp.]
MKSIKEHIENYDKKGVYPFHMPGHKRQMSQKERLQSGYLYDYTEITGFDNLHNPQGIIKEAQERAAKLYGAKNSYYLVNGSTAGILAAISAVCNSKDEILLHRGSHKAAYHAAHLRQLKISYLSPRISRRGLCLDVQKEEVDKALLQNPNVKAVFITSPTYDGIVSDVEGIAEVVHEHGAVLIVDEAHGAHFGFHPYFPDSAVSKGADLVIQSMHKTLNSYTQTALLHRCSDCVKEEKIMFYLDVYETSSPSYLFMAQMDACITHLHEHADEIFSGFACRLKTFYEQIGQLKSIQAYVPQEFVFGKDPSKILLCDASGKLSGRMIFETLRDEHLLELEMCAGEIATALTSYMDTQEGLDRLSKALRQIDSSIEEKQPSKRCDTQQLMKQLYQEKEQVMLPYETENVVQKKVPIEESAGHISCDYLYLYPPGIPFVVPGERITQDMMTSVKELKAEGYQLEGLSDQTNKTVKVVQ